MVLLIDEKVKENKKIELTSHNPQDKIYGFKEYIDILGKEHPEILIKIVSETEISFAYKLEFKVLYKGGIFLPTAIGKFYLYQIEFSYC